MKTAKPDFRVEYSKVPNGNKHWYIIGRPEGDRVRAWFRTKEEAQAEANERNTKMRKLGERAVTLDHALVASATRGATLLQVYGKTGRRRHSVLSRPSQVSPRLLHRQPTGRTGEG